MFRLEEENSLLHLLERHLLTLVWPFGHSNVNTGYHTVLQSLRAFAAMAGENSHMQITGDLGVIEIPLEVSPRGDAGIKIRRTSRALSLPLRTDSSSPNMRKAQRPGGTLAAIEMAQGDLGTTVSASSYGIIRPPRRNTSRVPTESERVRRVEQAAAERERLILEHGRGVIRQMGSTFDAHIFAAEREVEASRNRQLRAQIQLDQERNQAAVAVVQVQAAVQARLQ